MQFGPPDRVTNLLVALSIQIQFWAKEFTIRIKKLNL